MQRAEWLRTAAWKHHGCLCPLEEEHRGPSLTSFVRGKRAPGDFDRLGEINRRDLSVERNEGDVRQNLELLPWNIRVALRWEVPGLIEIEDDRSAPIDRE